MSAAVILPARSDRANHPHHAIHCCPACPQQLSHAATSCYKPSSYLPAAIVPTIHIMPSALPSALALAWVTASRTSWNRSCAEGGEAVDQASSISVTAPRT